MRRALVMDDDELTKAGLSDFMKSTLKVVAVGKRIGLLCAHLL